MTEASDRPLADQPWLRSPAARRVLAALTAGGRPARFVGGCVRDGLLGRTTAGAELDLATAERPEQVIRLLEAAGLRAIPTGLAHGTVSTMVDGQRFEITTLREDLATDGRHAEVLYTDDFEADAARRDFTINAMSCDGEGRLFDYFGGRADLALGRVRFVGEAARRIAEDYLRILRFFRFFAHYGRPPADAEALAAAAAAAPEIARLSGERIQAEMLKLLTAADPLPALRLMAEAGVLGQVIPGAVADARLARLLAAAPDADPLLRLAALLRPPPASAGLAATVAARWRLSNHDAERLIALTEAALPALAAPAAERRRARYRLAAQRYRDLVRLAAAEKPDPAALAAALAEATAWRAPKLPLGGDDLLASGLQPGPRVGQILAAVEAWWLERDFAPDRAACLAHAKALIAADGRLAGDTPKRP
jgi:poly(A) polymerase